MPNWSRPHVPEGWVLRCRQPELVWSHPKSRGGWKSHDADITHLHPADTLQTAETAYRFMTEFLARHAQFARRPPTDRAALQSRVAAFAGRNTRDAKYGWFRDEDARYQADPNEGLPYDALRTYPCFLEETSLAKRRPGDDYPRTRCADPQLAGIESARPPASPPPPLPLRNQPASPWVFASTLLETWLVRGDVTRVVEEMTAAPSVARAYSPASVTLTDDRIVELLLRAWRVDDHGLLNELGHGGEPARLEVAFSDTSLTATAAFAPAAYSALSDVVSVPCSSLPFELIRNDFYTENADGEPITVESYVIVFRIRHAPRDLMRVTIDRRPAGWQMTSLAWAAQ